MALKPIQIWIYDKYTDSEWASPRSVPRIAKLVSAADQAATEMGLDANDGEILYLRHFGDKLDKKLGSGGLTAFTLPQILLSTNSPTGTGYLFLAKLVRGQITVANTKTMLTAVRKLQPKTDPTTNKIVFYDPSLNLFDGIGLDSATDAPGGGYLIGLNPYRNSLEINRYGQIWDDFKKNLPKIGLAALLLTATYKYLEDEK